MILHVILDFQLPYCWPSYGPLSVWIQFCVIQLQTMFFLVSTTITHRPWIPQVSINWSVLEFMEFFQFACDFGLSIAYCWPSYGPLSVKNQSCVIQLQTMYFLANATIPHRPWIPQVSMNWSVLEFMEFFQFACDFGLSIAFCWPSYGPLSVKNQSCVIQLQTIFFSCKCCYSTQTMNPTSLHELISFRIHVIFSIPMWFWTSSCHIVDQVVALCL